MTENKENTDNRFQQYKNGPVHPSQRECRDILCCILILGNIAAMIVLAIYAYTYGDTSKIYRATDNSQNVCGQKGTDYQKFPYSYFYNPTTGDLSNRICVSQCPYYNSGGTLTSLLCKTNAKQPDCTYDKTVNQDGSYNGGNPSKTDVIGYESQEVIGRVCLPTPTVIKNAFKDVSTSISDGLRQAGVANFITDLQNNWKWLLLALVLAVVISFVFMFFLRCCAGCIIWLSIIALILVTVALGILFCYNGGAISRDNYIGNLGIQIPTLPKNDYYNIFGYISFGLAGLFFLLFLCCCSRIRLAVAVAKVAGQFVSSVCQVVLVPIFMGLLIFGLWVASVLAMIGLIGGADFAVNGSDIFTSIKDYTNNYLAMFYYYVFATLWTNALLQAITIFVIASACAIWYYNQSGPSGVNQKIDAPICTSFYMAIRYHFGSLAFGAFILALVQFIQFIIEVISKQIEQSGGQNKCTECIINCARCFVQCLKRIVQCLNRNAYIQIAITGKNYCSASYDAFSLIASNPIRYGILQGVGQILMLLGKLLIASLTTFLFYLFITFVHDVKANIQEPIYMLILIFIASYAIAVVFMAVYSVSMETVLACFIIDETSNKTAIHSPPELVALMDSD